MTKRLIIEVRGQSHDDLVLAVEAALESIKAGNLMGKDSNETGRYTFSIEEEN